MRSGLHHLFSHLAHMAELKPVSGLILSTKRYLMQLAKFGEAKAR
ncbi:hypothetical protein Patl1_16335 [Pistacia atlantica]|uniref:Uncharacterized protein n=1 Tax=Pistacia atlantica TaxID=434234 RepID=A0ACC1B9Q8_9ROSI|nr:hypothetical protein Patl1_16335 [Pistacia atlantica]